MKLHFLYLPDQVGKKKKKKSHFYKYDGELERQDEAKVWLDTRTQTLNQNCILSRTGKKLQVSSVSRRMKQLALPPVSQASSEWLSLHITSAREDIAGSELICQLTGRKGEAASTAAHSHSVTSSVMIPAERAPGAVGKTQAQLCFPTFAAEAFLLLFNKKRPHHKHPAHLFCLGSFCPKNLPFYPH